MALSDHFPALIVALLLFSAFLTPPVYRWAPRFSAPLTTFCLSAAFLMAILLTVEVSRSGLLLYHMGGWPPPWGIELKADPLRSYALLVILGVSLWIFVYALKDLGHELRENVIGWYYTLFTILVASMAAIALTNDLFNLFVLMEICTIAACGIISIKEDRECLEASFKYLILSAMGTGCYLLGVAMLYMATGYLNFDLLNGSLSEAFALYPRNIFTAAALFIVAFGTKSALFPLHVWLPDAHASAPSPSSAMLSGLVIKVFAIALFLIFYQVFPREILNAVPLTEIVLWLAAAGVMFGSIYAMLQADLKMMLAYSSIGQIGFIFLGLGLDQELAITGGFYHIMVHAITKAMLFMSAGVIIYTTGVRKIKDLAGIGRALPITMLAFTIGSASMIGLPGTGGLISKWFLALGALEAGRPLFVLVILASSLLNAVYYMPIIINAFMHQGEFEYKVRPVPNMMRIPLIIGALAVIATGLLSRPVIVMLQEAVASML